jgi:hypothetical protein
MKCCIHLPTCLQKVRPLKLPGSFDGECVGILIKYGVQKWVVERGGSFSVIELLVGLISPELNLRIPKAGVQAAWEHPFRIAHLHA